MSMKTFSEFIEESSTPERGRRRLSSRGPKKDSYQRGKDREETSNKIAVKRAGFKTKSQDGPHGSSDHYHSSSRHHSTNIASHKTQADYALSTVDRKYDRFSSSRRVEPTSSRVFGLKKIRRLLKTTRTAKPVHDISIHSDESGISKNDSKRLISRGKSFKKERTGVSDALKNAGAKTGDFAVGEPYGSMPHENPEKGKKVRAKLYGKDYGVNLDKRTGKMVGRVRTFEEFIAEARKRRIKVYTRYHGTTKSRADLIKSGGFKGGEGILGFGVYSTPSKKDAEYHAKRQSADSDDKPEVIQLRSIRSKNKNHHIHARNMYDRLPSKDPIKKDVTHRVKDRAQAHLKRGRDVTVTNFTDKTGKPIGKEVIQTPERATKDIVHNPSPIIRRK